MSTPKTQIKYSEIEPVPYTQTIAALAVFVCLIAGGWIMLYIAFRAMILAFR